MTKFDGNLLVGLVMLVLIVGLVYLSTQRGQVDLFDTWEYIVHAEFPTVGGLQEGAPVELAGVTIGRVDTIALVGRKAQVTMSLRSGVPLHEDAQAEIKAKGLIGERYIALSPGRSGEQIPSGGEIHHTKPAVDLMELLPQLFLGVGATNTKSDTTL